MILAVVIQLFFFYLDKIYMPVLLMTKTEGCDRSGRERKVSGGHSEREKEAYHLLDAQL